MWYIFVCLGLLFPCVQGGIQSTSQIYGQLQKAVKSENESLCNTLLETHYFTENPDDSIWHYAMKEHEAFLKRTFPREDHIAMNKDIRNIKEMWKNCRKTSDKRFCDEIRDELHKIFEDFQWPADGFQFHRIDYFSIRVAFQSMLILMFSSMLKSPYMNKFKDLVSLHQNILDEYNEITKYLEEFRDKIKEERPNEISGAEVCGIKKYLWKEFEQPACEKRWHKNEVLGEEKENGSGVKRAEDSKKDADEAKDDGDGDVDNEIDQDYDGDGSTDKDIGDDHGGKGDEYSNNGGDNSDGKNEDDGDENDEGETDELKYDGVKNRVKDVDEDYNGDKNDNIHGYQRNATGRYDGVNSGDNKRDKRNNKSEEDDDVDESEADENKTFFDVFANPDMNSVYLIGGKSGDYDLTLKSRFTDFGGKKEFLTGEKDINTRETQKSEVVEELINLTIDKRDEYVREKISEMDKYLKSTFVIVMKASRTFVRGLKKSLKFWKSQVNNKKTV